MRTPYVFLSYAREDSAVVDRLSEALDAHSPAVAHFLDRRDIPTGQPYPSALDIALRGCALVAMVLTPSSVRPLGAKLGVEDELVKSRSLGKPVLKLCVADTAQLDFTSPLLAGREGVEQLVIGSKSYPPSEDDYTLFADVVHRGLVDALAVSDLISKLQRTGRDTDASSGKLAGFGYVAVGPIVAEIERLVVAANERHVQGEECTTVAEMGYAQRLSAVLGQILEDLRQMEEETGKGVDVHPDSVDRTKVASLLCSALLHQHHIGQWSYGFDIPRALVALGDAAAMPALDDMTTREMEYLDGGLFPDTVLARAACGDDYALEQLVGWLGENSRSSQTALDLRSRRELIRGLGSLGDNRVAEALEELAGKVPEKLATEAREAQANISERLAGAKNQAHQLAARTLWVRRSVDDTKVTHLGLTFTRDDVLLALGLLELGFITPSRAQWGLSRPPATIDALANTGTTYALVHNTLDGRVLHLGPKDVYWAVEMLLTGCVDHQRYLVGGAVNKPFVKLGFTVLNKKTGQTVTA